MSEQLGRVVEEDHATAGVPDHLDWIGLDGWRPLRHAWRDERPERGQAPPLTPEGCVGVGHLALREERHEAVNGPCGFLLEAGNRQAGQPSVRYGRPVLLPGCAGPDVGMGARRRVTGGRRESLSTGLRRPACGRGTPMRAPARRAGPAGHGRNCPEAAALASGRCWGAAWLSS
jgi:hypothetical protein